jgi:hypothetical protein
MFMRTTQGATLDLAGDLRRLEGLHDALERRTRGVAWMVWGLVLPAVSVTYSYAGLAMVQGARFSPAWFLVLWMPWTLLGVLGTSALWRSVGLASHRSAAAWHGLKAFLLFALVVVSLYLAYHFLQIYKVFSLVGPSVFLMLVGVGTMVLGFSRWASPDRVERLLWAAGGVVLLVVVVVGTWIVGPVAHDAEPAAFIPGLRAFAIIAPLAIAFVYFGNGLYLSTRG